jgi:hypothetical protein
MISRIVNDHFAGLTIGDSVSLFMRGQVVAAGEISFVVEGRNM